MQIRGLLQQLFLDIHIFMEFYPENSKKHNSKTFWEQMYIVFPSIKLTC